MFQSATRRRSSKRTLAMLAAVAVGGSLLVGMTTISPANAAPDNVFKGCVHGDFYVTYTHVRGTCTPKLKDIAQKYYGSSHNILGNTGTGTAKNPVKPPGANGVAPNPADANKSATNADPPTINMAAHDDTIREQGRQQGVAQAGKAGLGPNCQASGGLILCS